MCCSTCQCCSPVLTIELVLQAPQLICCSPFAMTHQLHFACACRPCKGFGCGLAVYQFAAVGIAPCALNTSAPVGTRLPITFTVFDNGVPPLSSAVTRTLLITAPCPPGLFYCNGSCLQISCAASAALAAAAVTPVITLTSITAGAFGGASGGSAGVAYGTTPGFPLTPCSSYSEFPLLITCLADVARFVTTLNECNV